MKSLKHNFTSILTFLTTESDDLRKHCVKVIYRIERRPTLNLSVLRKGSLPSEVHLGICWSLCDTSPNNCRYNLRTKILFLPLLLLFVVKELLRRVLHFNRPLIREGSRDSTVSSSKGSLFTETHTITITGTIPDRRDNYVFH